MARYRRDKGEIVPPLYLPYISRVSPLYLPRRAAAVLHNLASAPGNHNVFRPYEARTTPTPTPTPKPIPLNLPRTLPLNLIRTPPPSLSLARRGCSAWPCTYLPFISLYLPYISPISPQAGLLGLAMHGPGEFGANAGTLLPEVALELNPTPAW